MRNFFIIFVCGLIGGSLRELLELSFQSPFHFVTLFINTVGALLMGMTYEYIIKTSKNSVIFSIVVGTGLIGSFTTFSTFMADTLNLFKSNLVVALVYLISSIILGLAALLMGKETIRRFYLVH